MDEGGGIFNFQYFVICQLVFACVLEKVLKDYDKDEGKKKYQETV